MPLTAEFCPQPPRKLITLSMPLTVSKGKDGQERDCLKVREGNEENRKMMREMLRALMEQVAC